MYVLDEPSIGLHQRDNQRLIRTLQHLRDLGNTVLVVEHDEETIRAADHLVDFGPGAGHLGGDVVFSGLPAATSEPARPASPAPTCPAAADPVPGERRKPKAQRGRPRRRRAQPPDIDVASRSASCVAVTGVSGAGKSSLVNGILLPALAHKLHDSLDRIGKHKSHRGAGRPRQGHRHRPAPDRPHPALQPRHLHQVLRRDPRALRPAARGARPRLGRPAASASTSRAAAARPARATAW
jgi:excinuclease ABC subunit A